MTRAIITSISIPSQLASEVEKEARAEHRTRSGFIQEAIRYYLEQRRWKKLQRDIAVRADREGIRSEEDVERLIDELRST